MEVFYIIPTHANITFLSDEESHHCIKVLRYQIRDTIYLVDGMGGWYQAIICDNNPKKCKVEILNKEQHLPKSYGIHIAVCPPKSTDRLEYMIEKLTELGADKISFIVSQRNERTKINIERIHKIIVAAAKQSLRSIFPIVEDMISFEQFIMRATRATLCIAHCNDTFPKTFLSDNLDIQKSNLILIGPEGDFTAAEIEKALTHQYQSVRLGTERLRTETAAIMACATCNIVATIQKNHL